MLFGHLAVSALEHRYLKAEFAPVMVAAVLPDAVDKVLHYVTGQTESGRLWGHTLLAALVTTSLVLAIWGRRSATSWALAYLSHLICDMGSVVPWLYPWVTYTFPESEGLALTLWAGISNLPRMALELGLSVWAFVALREQIGELTQQIRHRWTSSSEAAGSP